MRNRNLAVTFFGLVVLGFFVYLVLGSTDIKVVKETVNEMGEDTVRDAKSGIQKIQDAACEFSSSKVECEAEELKDDAEDAVEQYDHEFDQREYQ